MPVQHDPFSRIVNVQWEEGGGVFIAGDIDSNIYYLKLDSETGDDKKPAWENLGKLEFHKEDKDGFMSGRVAGSAYSVVDFKDEDDEVVDTGPVFVLVGGSGFANEFGIIMASRDGLNWSQVFSFGKREDSETYIGAGIFGVVWDDEARNFYAGGHQVDSSATSVDGIIHSWEEHADVLFQSSDGFSWSEVGRHTLRVETTGDVPFDYPEYKRGLLAAHCSDRVKDKNGNGIPDGNYGYDKEQELLIAPAKVIAIDYLFGIYLNDIPLNSFAVTVTQGDDPESYPTDVDIPTACTATVAGKWMAAGGVLGNFDEGKGQSQAVTLVASEGDAYTWESINPDGKNMIITMVGGMLETNKNAGL